MVRPAKEEILENLFEGLAHGQVGVFVSAETHENEINRSTSNVQCRIVRFSQPAPCHSQRSRLPRRSFMPRPGGISYFLTSDYADFREI